MAGVKISLLPPSPSSQLTDLIAAVQGGITQKQTLQQVMTLAGTSLSGTFLPLAGGTMFGVINMGGNIITNLPLPVVGSDAVNKTYADTVVGGGFTVILAADVATTANLNATPAGAGVGATLTNAGALAAIVIDGVALSVGNRVLVKNQTLSQHNGVYVVSVVGSGAVAWVLTRATDYDTPAEIQPGTLIAVNLGTVNATTSWLETATVTIVDTDPVLFSQFTFAPGAFFLIANNLSEGIPATMRTNLGLGTVATKTASDNTKTIAAMVNGATTIGNVAVFSDITGTIEDGGPSVLGMVNGLVNGRITLTSGTPVTTADVTAAATIFFTPFRGNQISLFDGVSVWNTFSFTQLSIAVPAAANTMYDLFIFDNAGTPTLETQIWTNDLTRAVALVFQDGVYVKSGATTRRYLGSFRTTNVAGQTEDSNAKRYVWNYYNRIVRQMKVIEIANSWNYSLAVYRQANANAANQLDYVIGISEDMISAQVHAEAASSTGQIRVVISGIGVDSTTINSGTYFGDTPVCNGGGLGFASFGKNLVTYTSYSAIGRHFLAWLERGAGADVQTWYGDQNASGSTIQSGISGWLMG